MGKTKFNKIEKIAGELLKIPIIVIWCAICFYPAIWYLSQDEAQQRRISLWQRYTRSNDKTAPLSDIVHRNASPNHNAIIKGKPDRINWAIMVPPEIDKVDYFGYTCLGYATLFNDQKLIRELIAKGADLNAAQRLKNTPLIIAAMESNREAITLLMDAGAKTDIQNYLGETPLHYAAKRDFTEIISKSNREITNFNIKDNKGLSPLDWAIKRNKMQSIIELTIAGAEPEASGPINRPFIEAYLALCKKTGDPINAARIFAEQDPGSDFQKLKSSYQYPAEFPVDQKTTTSKH